MKLKFKLVCAAVTAAASVHANAQITLYENEGFRGRVFSATQQVQNFENFGFNDRASSVIVERGTWEVCQDAKFQGRCVILRPGSYDTLSGMNMNDRISSVRPYSQSRTNRQNDGRDYQPYSPAPMSSAPYEYRRRNGDQIYQAQVTSVRAVVGDAEQRCWIERQQVTEPSRNEPHVGGAILGGILGGVIGHQIGGGRGNDVATAVGAIGGGVLGANVGRDGNRTSDRDVQRCRTVASTTPEYWDVTYNFRNVEHRLQMKNQPGATISVNQAGEPRM